MTATPRRFLFTMWEGGGTLPPELGLVRRLVERGHRVDVLGDATIAERADAVGAGFSSWRRAPHRTSLDPADDFLRDWEFRTPIAVLRNARDRFMAGPATEFAADTAEVIEAVHPHAVVADSMMLGSIIAAQAARLPVAAVMPNIWMLPTPGVPAVGPGFQPAKTVLGRTRDAAMRRVVGRLFDGGLPAINAAREAHGLGPVSSLFDQILDVDRVFVLSNATFDFASPAVPSHVAYVGPILDDPQWAEPWESPWPADNDDPLVLVGLSSTFQDQAAVLRRIVEALSSLPVRAVVTLGQMLGVDEVPGTDNVAVVPSAPHAPILDEADLVITHCGHGTTMKALAAGVPLVCIPLGRDQNDTAARVTHHGAGLRLSPKAAPAKIRAAVQRVLGDEAYRRSAERLASAIAAEQRHTDVTAELEALARVVEASSSE
jgi:MGT family glycosyltransferase